MRMRTQIDEAGAPEPSPRGIARAAGARPVRGRARSSRARRVGLLALTGLLGSLAACGEAAPPSDGEASPEAPLQELRFDTVAVLGGASGEPWNVFGGIWDLAAAPDGSFAVLDAQAPAVHLYDPSGAHRGSISEEGFVMGALTRPEGIAFSEAGDLFVWDPANRRISRYVTAAGAPAFAEMRSAEAFGETGFCVLGDRTYLSFLMDGQVVHEVGATGGYIRSFSEAPGVIGVEGVSDFARDMAREDLTPSKLFCRDGRILEVSAFQPRLRLHDADGALLWETTVADFVPVLPYSPDDMGVGLQYDETNGSHMARSIVPWGEGRVLVQYELRRPGARPAGADFHGLESRLIDLATGAELDRTRELPLLLAASDDRAFAVRQAPVPQVVLLARVAAP